MRLAHYVTLGRSGLRVSPLCLGSMTFGDDWGWGADVAECQRIMDRYLELGGNFIDTANSYTYGHSEKIIGDHLGRDPARRHQTVLATKFFGANRAGDPNAGGAGRKNVVRSCEESLRRLQTDYIDLYWMHCWDRHTPIDETLRALDDLVTAGKVRYIGYSDTPAWKVAQAQMLAQLHHQVPAIALQMEYSLLERSIEGQTVPMAAEFGLGITPWSPLKFGALSGKYRRNGAPPAEGRGWAGNVLDDHGYDVVELLVAIAGELGTTPARVALNWVSRQPGITSPIVGARTVAQLDENLAALDVALSGDQLARLDALTVPSLEFPVPFLKAAGMYSHPGLHINGEFCSENPLGLRPGQEPY